MSEVEEIKVFTVGGTIDKVYFDQKSAYKVGESVINEILHEANLDCKYSVEAILHKDSLDMSDADRQLVAARIQTENYRHLIITHGTDTMIKTARAVQETVKDKVIVFTGSMQPARFKESDAIFNVGAAFIAVQLLSKGVYIAMNGRIFDPRNSQKNVSLNRFESRG